MKPNKKHLRNFDNLSNQIIVASVNYDFQAGQLAKKHNINFNAEDLLDRPEYYEYLEDLGQVLAEYEIKQSILNAKRVAEILIGYNIAHRGKKLHPSKITKKLSKLPEAHAETIYYAINDDHFNSPVLTAQPYLHSILQKKYGVLLLDEKYFEYLHALLNNPRIQPSQKQREKIFAILKLFHSTTVKPYLNNKQK